MFTKNTYNFNLDDIDEDRICPHCNEDFSVNHNTDRKSYFMKHLEKCQKFHTLIRDRRTCTLCEKTFESSAKVLSHIEKCTDRIDQICETCKNDYTKLRPVEFTRHAEKCQKYYSQTLNGTTCKLCNNKFEGMGHLLTHVEKCVHKIKQTCKTCSQDCTKMRSVDYEKHVGKCEKFHKFVLPNNICRFCYKKFPGKFYSLTIFFRFMYIIITVVILTKMNTNLIYLYNAKSCF